MNNRKHNINTKKLKSKTLKKQQRKKMKRLVREQEYSNLNDNVDIQENHVDQYKLEHRNKSVFIYSIIETSLLFLFTTLLLKVSGLNLVSIIAFFVVLKLFVFDNTVAKIAMKKIDNKIVKYFP